MCIDLERIRADFPITKKFIYFNHATNSPSPIPVINAVHEYLSMRSEYGYSKIFCELFDKKIGIPRRRVADFINANDEEICFTKNTTEGINIIANAIKWKRGDEIIITEYEYPANYLPWIRLKKTKGVSLVVLKGKKGVVEHESFEKHITKKTKLIAVSHVNFFPGSMLDIENIGRIARENNILFLIDAIQSIGTMPFDLKKISCDFVACGGYKWLLAPEAVAFLYVNKRNICDLEPSYLGVESTSNVGYEIMKNEDYTLKPDARRFEGGGLNWLGIVAMDASIKYIQAIGINKIWKRILGLRMKLIEELERKGLEILVSREKGRESGIVSFRCKEPEKLNRELLRRNIIVALRENAIRVSMHFYNTEEEIENLLKCVT